MVRVPSYDDLTVGVARSPMTQVRNAADVNRDTMVSRSLASTGQSLQKIGADITEVELDAMEVANRTRVQDALNKLAAQGNRLALDPNEGFQNLKGQAAFERPGNQPLAVEYGSKFDQSFGDIEQTLGNEAQRELFRREGANVRANFDKALLSHEANEFRTYRGSVNETTMILGAEGAIVARDWQAIDDNLTKVKQAAYDTAFGLKGTDATGAELKARDAVSAVHKARLEKEIGSGDVRFADAYFRRYRQDMSPSDAIAVQPKLEKKLKAAKVSGTVGDVLTAYLGQITPNSLDRMINITKMTESSNRRFGPDGKILEGPMTRYGTAKGEMQVLDSTMTDPGLGVTPAQDDSPEERARVGRDYFLALLKRYGNDPAKAWAAFNWGFNDLDKVIKTHGDNWRQHLPEETTKYVNKNLRLLNQGAGQGEMPSKADILAEVRRRLGTDDPEQIEMAQELVEKQYKLIEDAKKVDADNAIAEVMQLLQAGEQWSTLDPQLKARIPVDKIQQVRNGAVNQTTDYSTLDLYLRNPLLWAQKTPAEKQAASLEIAPADIKRLDEMVAASNEVDPAIFARVSDARLRLFGYDLNDKDQKPEIAQQRLFMATVILTAQQASGRKMTEAEMGKALESLSTEMIQGSGKQMRVLDVKEVSDIPPAIRSAVRELAEKEYGRGISDEEFVYYYRLDQLRRNREIRNKAAAASKETGAK